MIDFILTNEVALEFCGFLFLSIFAFIWADRKMEMAYSSIILPLIFAVTGIIAYAIFYGISMLVRSIVG